MDAVHNWLTSSGIKAKRITPSVGRNWLDFNATIAEVEALLRTEYKFYGHETGQGHLACNDYSVPETIREHIDLIMPTVHFDTQISESDKKRTKRDLPTNLKPGDPNNTGFKPKKGKVIAGPNISPATNAYTLSNCNQYITPECLRALYSFSNGTLAKSSYGIVEYTPNAYLQSDLNLFYSNLAREIASGTAPIFDSIDGGVDQTTTQSFNDNGESDLDLQYAIALVYPQKVTLYQTGDLIIGASFNNFLDGIDASYCTSGGGDNPT